MLLQHPEFLLGTMKMSAPQKQGLSFVFPAIPLVLELMSGAENRHRKYCIELKTVYFKIRLLLHQPFVERTFLPALNYLAASSKNQSAILG